jgi:hypothetical protein
MEPSLEHYLYRPVGFRFLDFPAYFLIGKNVGLRMILIAVESTETAAAYTNIGVIYVPIADKGYYSLGMKHAADAVSPGPKFEEVSTPKERYSKTCETRRHNRKNGLLGPTVCFGGQPWPYTGEPNKNSGSEK